MPDELITNLIDDWYWLTTELPVPQRPEGRSSNTVNYGHPAQWASDKADEIADLLATLRDVIWEAMGAEVPYGHADHLARDSQRIRRAGFVKLAEYFLDPENDHQDIRSSLKWWADDKFFARMESVHKEVLSERTSPEPVATKLPCPRCESALNIDWGPPAQYACSACDFTLSTDDYLEYHDALVSAEHAKFHDEPVLVTIKYACTQYKLSRTQVQKWIDRGHLQRRGKDEKGRTLIDKREIEVRMAGDPGT